MAARRASSLRTPGSRPPTARGCTAGTCRRPNARAAVLFCHGNGGNITHRVERSRCCTGDVGVSVLIFDYRGYGRSEGKPSEAGVLADARAARAWLAAREKIAETDVVLMGESIGGAVAVDLAARDGARALVLESTFSSLARRGGLSLSLAAGPLGDAHAVGLGRQDRRLSRPAACRPTATPTRSCRCGSAAGCSRRPTSRSSSCCCPATTTTICRPEYYDALAGFLGGPR